MRVVSRGQAGLPGDSCDPTAGLAGVYKLEESRVDPGEHFRPLENRLPLPVGTRPVHVNSDDGLMQHFPQTVWPRPQNRIPQPP